MTANVSPRVTLSSVFELLRYTDLLENIAEEHRQSPFVAALLQIRQLLESPARDNLDQIERQADDCAREIAGQLQALLTGARTRCEQHQAEHDSLAEAIQRSLSAELQRQLIRMQDALERDIWHLTQLEDALAEVEWCRTGFAAAARAIGSGAPPLATEFPTRHSADRPAFAQWLAGLAPAVKSFAVHFPAESKSLLSAMDRLHSPLATVTFGGRFKSGKSSLLNAALQRSLLPTYDLPWTGANCHLMSGAQDVAELVTRTETKLIPCQTDALQKAISLQGGRAGNERTADVHRLNLRLARFPGGSHVQWVDPPGMFDRPEMTERAWDAANQADVIVWVFRSQQFLGESEAEAIAEFICRRGTSSIIFVENAWLEKEHADPWGHHLREITPVDVAKLHYLSESLGFPKDQLPALYVVSAEKVLQQGHGFGAATLRRLLWKMSGPDAPLIRRARLKWACLELQRAAELVRTRWQSLQAENAARQTKLDAQTQKQDADKRAFESLVKDAVAAYVSGVETAATSAGLEISNSITSSVEYDGRYAAALNERIFSTALYLANVMIDKLNQACEQKQQKLGDNVSGDKIWELVKPDEASVQVAAHSASGGAVAGGAVAGAAAGAWFFGIGAVPGAVIGSLIAGMSSGASASQQNCAETKVNIQNAASAVGKAVRDKQRRIGKEILGWSEPLEPPGEKLATPDKAKETELDRLQQQLLAAADACLGWLRKRSA